MHANALVSISQRLSENCRQVLRQCGHFPVQFAFRRRPIFFLVMPEDGAAKVSPRIRSGHLDAEIKKSKLTLPTKFPIENLGRRGEARKIFHSLESRLEAELHYPAPRRWSPLGNDRRRDGEPVAGRDFSEFFRIVTPYCAETSVDRLGSDVCVARFIAHN